MTTDQFDCPITLADELVPTFDKFTTALLQYRADIGNIVDLAAENPAAGMVQVAAGMLAMFTETIDSPGAAKPYLERARLVSGLNPRERLYVAVLGAWCEYRFAAAATAAEDILEQHPTDLLALRLVHYFRFELGDYPAMLRAAKRCGDVAADQASYWTMLAFAHEQCHQIDAARDAAETALALQPDHPWGQHALAHVYLSVGDVDGGRTMMRAAASGWTGLNSFMSTHLWWHLALFEIAKGSFEAALTVFDRYCWGINPSYSQDQIGAVSLLTQLELAGVDVGDRWDQLRPYLESRAQDAVSPFRALQYLYGLTRCGSDVANDLLAAIRRQTRVPLAAGGERRWAEVAMPAAEGLYSAAIGQHDIAVRRLTPVIGRLWTIGGSHAQRDLFTQLWLHSLMQNGNWVAAQQQMQLRANSITDHVVTQMHLDRIHQALSL